MMTHLVMQVLNEKGLCGRISGEPPHERACIMPLGHADAPTCRSTASLGPYQEGFEAGVRAAAQLSIDEGADSFAAYLLENLLGPRRAAQG